MIDLSIVELLDIRYALDTQLREDKVDLERLKEYSNDKNLSEEYKKRNLEVIETLEKSIVSYEKLINKINDYIK